MTEGAGVGMLDESGVLAATALPDDRLIAQIAGGDDAALVALYRRYARQVYSLALRMLSDEESTEEVVQDTFVRVWHRAAAYDASRARFGTWILGITHNLAVDELRRRRARPSTISHNPHAEGDARLDFPSLVRAHDPQSVAEASDVGTAVRVALRRLPREQRAAIELAYFGGLTQSEIADATGVPLGTIKSRIRLGMVTLQNTLAVRDYGPIRRTEVKGENGG
ncbi:MAG: sigma-70 family RNA polymerase sigma factor [Chloroflexota bacterium]